MEIVWIVAALATIANCELLLTVSPEFVKPGLSPSFALNCALLENEEAGIVSLTISRRTVAQGNIQTGAAEQLVSLSAMTPGMPAVNAQYPYLTALGQITNFESELGSYVQLVWPSPTVQDLGVYTCDAVVVGEMGTLTTLTSPALVTTADPMIDRLLLAVSELENKVETLNTTQLDLQEQLNNISVPLYLATDVPSIVADVTEAMTSTTAFPEDTTTPAETTEGTTASPLDRLASAVESLNSKLDQINASMVAMERKLGSVPAEEAENETEVVEQGGPDHVQNFFTFNSSIYFLISGARDFSTYTAQALCESQGLFLAEVQDQAVLDAISDNNANYVLIDQLVLVGGRQTGGSEVWTYQDSQTKVSYFGGGAPPVTDAVENNCLALEKSRGGFTMVAVVCSEPLANALVLCEDLLYGASGEVAPETLV